MPIDAIGLAGTGETSVPKNAAVDQTQFLKILLTQLRFQDPLKPVDNQQFVAQLAQFSALEINRQQSEKIDNLMQIDASTQAIGLLGRQVETRLGTGTVTAYSLAGGQGTLTVNTPSGVITDVHLSDVLLIREGT